MRGSSTKLLPKADGLDGISWIPAFAGMSGGGSTDTSASAQSARTIRRTESRLKANRSSSASGVIRSRWLIKLCVNRFVR